MSFVSTASESASVETVDLNENEKAEKAKALDADSSKDLKAMFGDHGNEESNATKAMPTEYVHSTQKASSSKRSSTSQAAVARPASETDRLPVESVITDDDPSKNQSFLQASLGEINPTAPEQNQMSSVVGEFSPETTMIPSTQGEEKVSEKVSTSQCLCAFIDKLKKCARPLLTKFIVSI